MGDSGEGIMSLAKARRLALGKGHPRLIAQLKEQGANSLDGGPCYIGVAPSTKSRLQLL